MQMQLTIYDFLNEPVAKPVNQSIFGTFIIKLRKGKYHLWFRDFLKYKLTADTKIKEITNLQSYTEDKDKCHYKEMIGYTFSDICVKQYGYYQSHLNEYDYKKRDEVLKQIITRFSLNVSLAELLEMTLEEFIQMF